MFPAYLATVTFPSSQSHERHLLPSVECNEVTCCRHFCLKNKKNKEFCSNSLSCNNLPFLLTVEVSFHQQRMGLQHVPTSSQSMFLLKQLKRNCIQDELQSWPADFSYFPSSAASKIMNIICLNNKFCCLFFLTKSNKNNQEWKNAMLVTSDCVGGMDVFRVQHPHSKIGLPSQYYHFPHIIRSQLMDVFTQSLCFQLLA